MRRSLSIYRAFIRIALLGAKEYRADFLAGLGGIAILNLVDVALLYLVISQFTEIAGWSFWDLAFMTFFYLLVLGIENFFGVHFLSLQNVIRDGTFDRYLLRPIPSIIQFVIKQINIRYLDHLVLAPLGMLFCLAYLDISWGFYDYLFLAVNIVAASVALGALVLTLCSVSFWTVKSAGLVLGTMEIQEIIQHYPINVFGNAFARFVTFVLPFALMSYFPTSFLLRKPVDPFPAWIQHTTPLYAVVLTLLAILVWNLGVRHYESTGS